MNKKISLGIKKTLEDVHKESNLSGDIYANVYVKLDNKKKEKLPSMMMVFQKAAEICATKLSPSASRILLYFISQSAYENFIGIDVKSIQTRLSIKSKSTVINAIKELIDNSIIIKVNNVTDARRNDYFINPYTAWKGSSTKWNAAKKRVKEINPQQMTLFLEEQAKIESDFSQSPKNEFDDFE
jgi:DNA-binding MarR family transcriptional regulator